MSTLKVITTTDVAALEQMARDSIPALASLEGIDFAPETRIKGEIRLKGGLRLQVDASVQPGGG